MKQLEDGFNEWLELGDCGNISIMGEAKGGRLQLTGRCAFVGQKDTTPSIHDTLAKRDNVVDHLVGKVGAGGDARGLLQDLANNRQVGVELGSDGLSNVTEGLEDRGLELVGGSLVERVST